MPVHPQIQQILDVFNRSRHDVDFNQLTPQMMRMATDQNRDSSVERELVKKVENLSLPLEGRSIPIRIYTPEGHAPFPALVYYHGGGFVIGNLETVDSVCRNFANNAKCVVISIDYRLAPEHPFPAGLEDAYDSLLYISDHADQFEIDPSRIAVGGDSAGGNFATVVSLMAKERQGPPIVFQLLIYPAVGIVDTAPYPSMQENASGYLMDVELLNWFLSHYLPPADLQNPYLDPINGVDLTGLPPAMVITAEYDPLRDGGKTYADKLRNSGVDVVYRNEQGFIHSFIGFHTTITQAQESLDEMSAQLRKAFKV
ncbi:alpha/beta hydrolase [Brevibacillus formosus]|uniref:alpha/beta hydrolase n=1 Tax=Brevibacillus formosus TaxID=54913 RepID=UPI0018CEB05B|nr:alpha/beta hydrolase [Brevibacillus formosus]MBG9945912.1 alpha/beta hydrolase [Brevibacillus formosus]